MCVLVSMFEAKPSSAKPVTSPSDEWENSLITARCNSARRILSKKDSAVFKSTGRLQFPPLNPKLSLTSNDGAVPISKYYLMVVSLVVEGGVNLWTW